MERAGHRLSFGDFELDLERGELRRAGRRLELAPKPLALLIYLAVNRTRAVPKEELLEQLWPDVFVSETALSSALKDLRRALGDDGARMSMIQTLRRRGYRFAALPDEPVRAPLRAEAPPAQRAGPRPPRFVGRSRELAWLAERAREAARGRARVALVSGEAGVGKTRLLEELARDPSCADLAVVTGRCTEDASLPYLPFVEALSSWLLKSDESSDMLLGEEAPGLRQLLHPGTVAADDVLRLDRFDGARDRAGLFAAVFELITRLALRRPTVLALEDLHAADAASLDLMSHLVASVADARTSGALPLLIVATTRAPADGSRLATLLARLQRETICDSLELSGLDAAATRQLAAELSGARPAPRLLRALDAAAAGNPLFIREFLRFGGAGGLRIRDSGDGDGSGQGAPSLPRPDSLRAAIAARVARLDEAARSALVIAAFIGDRFGALALAVACGMSPDAVGAALAAAAREGLVVGEGRSFRFEHGLVREVLRAHASEARRAAIHRDLADVLEDLYASASGEHALEIAHHLLRAGDDVDPARLLRCARRAGDQAFAVCAWHEAGRLYAAAADSSLPLAPGERASLCYRAALAAGHDAQDASASRLFERAAELYAGAGDDAGRARAWIGLVRARITTPAVASAGSLDVRPLEQLAERLDEKLPALSALALETVAEALWTAGDAQRAEATSARALVIGHNLDDDVVCQHASMGLGLARFSQLRIRDAVECWRESLAHARRTRDPWLASTPSSRIMLGQIHLGRLREARAMAREALALAERAQNRMDLSFVLAQETCLDVAQGEFATAERSARAALHAIERSRYPWGGPIVIGARACAAALRGAWLDAETALEELVAKGRIFAAPSPAMQFLVATYRTLITAQRAPAEVDGARVASLLQLLPPGAADVRLLPSLCALAEAAAQIGDAELCARAEPALRTAWERGVVLSAGWVFSLARVLGGCAAVGKRRAEAEEWYELALRQAREEGVRVEQARVLVDRARLRVERGDLDDAALARADLVEAEPLLRELALAPLAAEAERVAARLEL